MRLGDGSGQPQAQTRVEADGATSLELGLRGPTVALLTSEAVGGGGLVVTDMSGEVRIAGGVAPGGDARLQVYDERGTSIWQAP
jgi:hypothetical protein